MPVREAKNALSSSTLKAQRRARKDWSAECARNRLHWRHRASRLTGNSTGNSTGQFRAEQARELHVRHLESAKRMRASTSSGMAAPTPQRQRSALGALNIRFSEQQLDDRCLAPLRPRQGADAPERDAQRTGGATRMERSCWLLPVVRSRAAQGRRRCGRVGRRMGGLWVGGRDVEAAAGS
jgi:hypothetical protein